MLSRQTRGTLCSRQITSMLVADYLRSKKKQNTGLLKLKSSKTESFELFHPRTIYSGRGRSRSHVDFENRNNWSGEKQDGKDSASCGHRTRDLRTLKPAHCQLHCRGSWLYTNRDRGSGLSCAMFVVRTWTSANSLAVHQSFDRMMMVQRQNEHLCSDTCAGRIGRATHVCIKQQIENVLCQLQLWAQSNMKWVQRSHPFEKRWMTCTKKLWQWNALCV